MASLLMLFRPARKQGAQMLSTALEDGSELRSVYLDATLSESFESSLSWTEHPVEDGSTISDHAVRLPRKLSLSGVVTRAPAAMITGPNPDPAHLDDTIRALEGLMTDRQPVSVYTGLRAYPRLYVESLSVSRSAGDGQRANVQMSLREIEIVEAQTALVPPLPVVPEKKADATPEQSQGTQSPTETTPTSETGGSPTGDDAEDKSFAADLWDRGSSFFGGE